MTSYGLGWLPDYYDLRDDTHESEKTQAILSRQGKVLVGDLPNGVDLKQYDSAIHDQGHLGSCTADAGASLFEHCQNRAHGKFERVSRLAIYKLTRLELGFKGDTGAFLRSTMGALVLYGVMPEKFWPYDVSRFDKEPPAWLLSRAQNFQAVRYFRHDPPGQSPQDTLFHVKRYLASGFPVMFGTTVYESIFDVGSKGLIPFPTKNERAAGGHAMLIVGYDDKIRVPGAPTTGVFLLKNSWGKSFGMDGYAYLPFDYLLSGLADDFWSLVSAEWVDTGAFSK